MFSLIILLFARKIPARLGESLELAKHKIQFYFPIEAKTKSAIAGRSAVLRDSTVIQHD